jgi:hypothetical protein
MIAAQDPAMTTRSKGRSLLVKTRFQSQKKPKPVPNMKKKGVKKKKGV